MARRALDRQRHSRWVLPSALMVMATLLGACGTSTPAPPVALMVVPHPDDELAATAVIAPLTDASYEVMMLLITDGEATRRCGDDRGTDACRERRVAAWEQVADALGIDGSRRRRAEIPDGAATEAATTAAICDAVAQLESDGRSVAVLVAASYFGGDGEVAVIYEHDDHDATNRAVIAQRCVEVPRLVRVPINEQPELLLDSGTDLYAALLGDDGVAQQAYGWLAFDFVTGGHLDAWAMSDTDRVSPFSREQGFACWDATGTERSRRHCVIDR